MKTELTEEKLRQALFGMSEPVVPDAKGGA
ncbi:hypothetical protein QF045_002572 [Pseudomonas sp. W4I3]|nr:hypothetical protein [Pseudomonas sp. W4I3]